MFEDMTVMFCGSGLYAVSVLRLLTEKGIVFTDIVTQAAKPAGRKKELRPTLVAEFVKSELVGNSKLHEINDLRSKYADLLRETNPGLIMVVDYGEFIPKGMLDYPVNGVLNLHPSLLPVLRGAVPMHMAILKRFSETGVTLQQMGEKMDAGPIIAQRKITLTGDEYYLDLLVKSAEIGSVLIEEALPGWLIDHKSLAQDDSQATYCYEKDIRRDNAQISYSHKLEDAYAMVRAFSDWPVAWVNININGNMKSVKIFRATPANRSLDINGRELEIFRRGKDLLLSLSDGDLMLEELQVEGMRRMSSKDYLGMFS